MRSATSTSHMINQRNTEHRMKLNGTINHTHIPREGIFEGQLDTAERIDDAMLSNFYDENNQIKRKSLGRQREMTNNNLDHLKVCFHSILCALLLARGKSDE